MVKGRLIAFLEVKGINKSQFGRLIGVSDAYVSSMRQSIPPDKLQKIAEQFPDLNIGWLLTGVGKMLLTEVEEAGTGARDIHAPNAQAVGANSSAEINTDSGEFLAVITRFQTQIEKMEADARAERERILADARAERERLYSLLEKLQ